MGNMISTEPVNIWTCVTYMQNRITASNKDKDSNLYLMIRVHVKGRSAEKARLCRGKPAAASTADGAHWHPERHQLGRSRPAVVLHPRRFRCEDNRLRRTSSTCSTLFGIDAAVN